MQPESALAGAFGPVVIVRGVPDVETALAAANASPFGLAASVWSRDTRAARSVAARLDAGMVTVNEAVTPAMHAAAPFGGTKASGFGRTHGRARPPRIHPAPRRLLPPPWRLPTPSVPLQCLARRERPEALQPAVSLSRTDEFARTTGCPSRPRIL